MTAKVYDNNNDATVSNGVTVTVQQQFPWVIDTTTQGCWSSTGAGYLYGSSGYVLSAWNSGTDVLNLGNSYVQSVTPSNQANFCWATSQTDPRATVNPGTGTRNAACWYSGGAFDVNVTLITPMTASYIAWPSTAWIGMPPRATRPSTCRIP